MTRTSEEPLPHAKPLVLKRFDILKLYTIDTVKENFSCEFILEFILPEGTNPSTAETVPVDTRNSDFQLSARWYLGKIEPQNVSGDEPAKLLDSSCFLKNGQTILQMRFKGTFFLELDLKDFPVDTQELTIKMIYLCQTNNTFCNGSLRAKFELGPERSCVLSMAGFMNPKDTWRPLGLANDKQSAKLSCLAEEHSAGDRTFPALTATLRVRRKQLGYYNYNVALPSGLISGLSLVTFSYPPNNYSSRVSTALSLMIAASAYLQVVAAKVPQTNTMTKLDKYMARNFIMLAAVVLVGGTMHHAIDNTTIDSDGWPRPAADWVLFAVLSCSWTWIQLSYFGSWSTYPAAEQRA